MAVRRKGYGDGGDILDEAGNIVRWGTSMRRRARELRTEMTAAESALWNALRRKSLHGLKFYRQVAIDRFIPDFFCPEKRLVVEVDGDIHTDAAQREHDAARDDFLRRKGVRILRLTNEEVLDAPEQTLRKIAAACGVVPSPSPSPPAPSPRTMLP